MKTHFENGRAKAQSEIMNAYPVLNVYGSIVTRIGGYAIIEGIGPDGGFWFAKGHGELKKFKTRKLAEEHAQLSSDF